MSRGNLDITQGLKTHNYEKTTILYLIIVFR